MSLLIKTIHGRKYVYSAYRSGRRVIHKYVGPASSPQAKEALLQAKLKKAVPKDFYPLFWDADPLHVDLRRHARYIIERVLEMGGLRAVRWIQCLYPTRTILEICLGSRRISLKSRNFWALWFQLPA